MFLDSITPKPEASVEFLDFWFGGIPATHLISVLRIHPTRPQTVSFVFTLAEVREAIETSGLDALTWSGGDSFDLYFSVATLKDKPEAGKRGGLKNVREVPGVWADLDVKPGYFESQEEILDFLNTQEHPPSAVVLTGNQGAHAYWKLDKPMDVDKARELCLWWWVYQSKLTEFRIDKLVDPSRVMRLPGSVRWPKKVEQGTSVCEVILNDIVYTKDTLQLASEPAWVKFDEANKARKEQQHMGSLQVEQLTKEAFSDSSNPWFKRLAQVGVEPEFNSTYSWESILEPHGWTKLNTDPDGRVFWSRPGDGVRKSATTDWPESPDIMSLFSTAPETGLLSLLESGMALSKYRVWIELVWGGDELGAVNSFLGMVK